MKPGLKWDVLDLIDALVYFAMCLQRQFINQISDRDPDPDPQVQDPPDYGEPFTYNEEFELDAEWVLKNSRPWSP